MTENNYLIYALQSPKKDHNLYVGQTKDYANRMKKHQQEDSGCPAISRAIKKYKWENIKRFVLIEGLTQGQANYWEQHYIFIFDSFHNGMNLTSGGDNCEVSQITKDRISATLSAKGDNYHTKRLDVRAKNSAANMGDNNPAKRLDVRAKKSASLKALGDRHPMKLWENKINMVLTKQLHRYERLLTGVTI